MDSIDLFNYSKRYFNWGFIGMLENNGPKNFKSTTNIRRSKNGVLGIFGDGIFKSGGRIEVIDSWVVESTQESKDSMEESRNHHQWS
jgi:hypothetical protein